VLLTWRRLAHFVGAGSREGSTGLGCGITGAGFVTGMWIGSTVMRRDGPGRVAAGARSGRAVTMLDRMIPDARPAQTGEVRMVTAALASAARAV
jgi:hypothetical protein